MATASNEAREVVNAGGKNMTFMGILALLAPGMTGLPITIMLAAYFIIDGIAEAIGGFQGKQNERPEKLTWGLVRGALGAGTDKSPCRLLLAARIYFH